MTCELVAHLWNLKLNGAANTLFYCFFIDFVKLILKFIGSYVMNRSQYLINFFQIIFSKMVH